jgi:hypothetical protein
MLLFQKRFHAGLVSGAVTLTFRQWVTPRVKPGGRYRVHPIGVVECDGLERIGLAELSEADAVASGFSSRAELLSYFAQVAPAPLTEQSQVWKVRLHHAGDGDRVQGAMERKLTPEDLALLRERLARLDRRRSWTATVLALIAKRPKVAASQLAASLGRPTLPFKVDVRKLKRLGLTQSFEVGYGLTPRGRSWLKAAGRDAQKTPARQQTPKRASSKRASSKRASSKRASSTRASSKRASSKRAPSARAPSTRAPNT